ncbi:MAG: helix-turn-helix transcriptional regulator [Candidatus Gastranaerophilaceae bacterium]
MMKSLKQKLGARIQEIRKSKNLTQEVLAEKIDMDKPNLSNIECGKRFMTAETLEKLANALEVEEKELFDFGHIQNRKELITLLNDTINNASDSELMYLYKVISALKYLKP